MKYKRNEKHFETIELKVEINFNIWSHAVPTLVS